MPSCQVYMMETCSYMMKIAFSINILHLRHFCQDMTLVKQHSYSHQKVQETKKSKLTACKAFLRELECKKSKPKA